MADVTKEALEQCDRDPLKSALRDRFEHEFGHPLDLEPCEYVAWLEGLVLGTFRWGRKL